jgi:hypothetical protein
MGDGGWGCGALAKTPTPQSPIPNPQSPIPIVNKIKYKYLKLFNKINIIYI